MKKITLIILILFGFFPSHAQIFQNENFEGLTIGNVGTDITGITLGQGGLLTLASGGQNSDFQIINEGGTQGYALQLTGSSTDTGDKFVWLSGLDADWAARTPGNDVLEVEYDFYTGPTTTSKSVSGIYLFNSSFNIIAGFYFVSETKEIYGLAREEDGFGTPTTYLYNLGASTIVLSANTWYRVGLAFNKTTGEVTWKGPGFYGGIVGYDIGLDPIELDFTAITAAGNVTSFNFKHDNFVVKASSVENLLGLYDKNPVLANALQIYPNPVSDEFIITNANNISIKKLELVDINGRTIKSITINENITKKQIDISDVSKGVYLLNVHSQNGVITKKIIKE